MGETRDHHAGEPPDPAGEATPSTAYRSSLRIELDDGRVLVDPSPQELAALRGGTPAAAADAGPAPEPVVAVVRVWHGDQGWGIVDAPTVPGGCWVHFSAIDASGYRELRAGRQVLVDVEDAEQDGCAYRATRVQVLAEGHPGA